MAEVSAKARAKEIRRQIITVVLPQMKAQADGWIHNLSREIVKIISITGSQATGQLMQLVKMGELERRSPKSSLYRLPVKKDKPVTAVEAGKRNLARHNARRALLKGDTLTPLLKARIAAIDAEDLEIMGKISDLNAQRKALAKEREELEKAL